MVYGDHFNLVWGIQYGTVADEQGYEDIQVDSVGDIYTMWTLRDGSTTTTYRKKLDRMSNLIWQNSELRNYTEVPKCLVVDPQDNYCIVGYTDGPSGGAHYGSYDGFLRKYNTDGQLLWSRQIGTSNYDTALDGTCDSQGNIFVCGHTYGALAGTPGGLDSWAAKYDSEGTRQWVVQYNIHNHSDGAGRIEVSPSGELYLSLHITDGNESSEQAGLLKLDSNGSLLWVREIGLAGVQDGGMRLAGFDAQDELFFRWKLKGLWEEVFWVGLILL